MNLPKWYLIVNEDYYPSSGLFDWKGPYHTQFEAESCGKAYKTETNMVTLIEVVDNEVKTIPFDNGFPT